MDKITSNNILDNETKFIVPNAARVAPINYEVSAGDIVSDYTLESGGVITVLSGGSTVRVILNSGAQQFVAGGTVNSGTVCSGGVLTVLSGGNTAEIILKDKATQYVSSGGIDLVTSVFFGATQYVNGGTVNNVTIGINIGEYYSSRYRDYVEYCTSTGGETIRDTMYYVYTLPPAEQYVMSGSVINGGTITSWYNEQSFGGGASTIGWQQSTVYTNYTHANQYISNGGSVNDISLDGGNQYIYSGGVANNTINFGGSNQFLGNGGTQYIYSGGVANNTSIGGVGHQVVNIGATANKTAITGGSQIVSGMANDTRISLNGSQSVVSGGVAISSYVDGGGQYIFQDSVAISSYVDGGEQYIFQDGVVQNTIIDGGIQHISSGGVASNTTLSKGSINIHSAGLLVGDITIPSGGFLQVETGGKLEANVSLSPGGSVTIGLSNGGSVDLVGDNNRGLIIGGYTLGVENNITTEINGFSGQDKSLSDKIQIAGLQAANVSNVTYLDDNHIQLQLLDGTSFTLNIIGIKQTGYSLGSDIYGNLMMAVCFLSGTLIKMGKGDCAVEDIEVGDIALTYDPQSKAKVKKTVTWVGKKTARVNSKLSDDLAGYPVRVLKDTFKKGVPNKDLLITPEHCLFIDGYFIPVRMLVNGRSIFYDYSIIEYDYYHVETEDHSIIWADNMLTESYLNTGNRHQFNKDAKVVTLDRQAKNWEDDAVVPLRTERSFVEAIFNRLLKRANRQKLLLQAECDFILCNDHGLYLLTEDGKEIYQSRVEKDQIIFILPANTQEVYLVSKKIRPCDLIGPFVNDRRSLGVLVGKVCVLNEYGSYPIMHYLKEEDLQGWSVVEDEQCRWTMGCAVLPLDVYNIENDFELSIQVKAGGPYLVKNSKDEEQRIAG